MRPKNGFKSNSSFISYVSFDEETNTLSITMRSSGQVYKFSQLPDDSHYKKLKKLHDAGKSLGAYFNNNLKGQYV